MHRVGEQGQASGEAQVPEHAGKDGAAGLIRQNPLHQETRAEEQLARESDYVPNVGKTEPATHGPPLGFDTSRAANGATSPPGGPGDPARGDCPLRTSN